MKMKHLVGLRFKERPADCVIESHALMIRGGYMKYVGSGIYSEYPVLRRITKKIEEIIREEMDEIDGQEVLLPVAMPADLWEESGRYESVGRELLRFEDRCASKMVLGMTHEEAAVALVREYGQSYQNYPFMIYQFQRKFRDEARPRAGMIRVREFTMKDGYSFHTSEEDLDRYYERCLEAYRRIFRRVGIPQTVVVAADSGMMGGSISHEFMLLADAGEDSIILCENCDYRANMEAAENFVAKEEAPEGRELKCVETPDCETIEEVCAYLGRDTQLSCKAVAYQRVSDDGFVLAFLRGDCQVSETKLRNLAGGELRPAVIDEDAPIIAGYIGPLGISDKVECYFDRSLQGMKDMAAGANKEGYHYIGFDAERDLGDIEYHDISKVQEGSICPCCGRKTLKVRRGIEVGNIFKLGTKYTESMHMQYMDEHDRPHYPLMGCYGIGIGRLAAAVCEVSRDKYGPIWPASIAPFEAHICCLRADDEETRRTADEIYKELKFAGVDTLYDDRVGVRAGEMFADADLIGAPIRIVISPRNLKNGEAEVSLRGREFSEKIKIESLPEYIKGLKTHLLDKIKEPQETNAEVS